jgi:hypothetical protein
MKAIRTKYYGPTATKPAHIKASDGDGNYVRLNHRLEFLAYAAQNSHPDHREAAENLCKKMNWTGKLVGGGYKDSMYWVFAT